jgi:hypothetical protein
MVGSYFLGTTDSGRNKVNKVYNFIKNNNMNKNRRIENKLALSLIICLSIMIFSCKDEDFDKNYTLVDAGSLSVSSASLTFNANAGMQEVSLTTPPPEGSRWGYRKSADWISVVQYGNRLEISVPLYEGLTYNNDLKKSEIIDRKGTVTLVKEAEGGLSVEAESIAITQTYTVPSVGNWDSNETPYAWSWDEKSEMNIIFTDPTKWNETALDGDGNPYYKYVYKIIGDGASSFEQTVKDTVRPDRTIKIANKDDNSGKEKDVIAYFIVTDKDGENIYVRRKLTVEYRKGDFALDPDKVTVSADKTDVEVEAVSLSEAADKFKCKFKQEGDVYDWITFPPEDEYTYTGGGKFKFTIAANPSTSEGREAEVELVKDSGASFTPPVFLTIKQNQKSVY